MWRILFQSLALGDITNDAGENATSAGQHGFADGEVDGEAGAVFALAHDLTPDADDAIHSGVQVVLNVAVVPVAIGLRHEQADVFADDLSTLVAKEANRGGVGGFDDAIGIDRNDGIDRCFDDGAGDLLAGLKCSLQLGNAGRQALVSASAYRISIWSDDKAIRLHGKDRARGMLHDFFGRGADEHLAQAGFAIGAEHHEGGVHFVDMIQNGFTDVHALLDVLSNRAFSASRVSGSKEGGQIFAPGCHSLRIVGGRQREAKPP